MPEETFEHPEQRGVKAHHIQDSAGLRVPLDSRFRVPCRKGYRRVMRQTERATRRPKIVQRVFGAMLAGNVKLDPVLLKKLAGQ
jgi:hypothetical protein